MQLLNLNWKNIYPWKIFTPEKYSTPMFTPEKYSLPENIHPWKIFTLEKYLPLKIRYKAVNYAKPWCTPSSLVWTTWCPQVDHMYIYIKSSTRIHPLKSLKIYEYWIFFQGKFFQVWIFFEGWICSRSEYFSGVNISQRWIFFRGEYFSGVNIFQEWTFLNENLEFAQITLVLLSFRNIYFDKF